MPSHKDIAAVDAHVPGYLQSGDPGAVGAGKQWIDTTAGTGLWVLKIRNAANTGWETVGSGGGGGGAPTTADYLVGTANAGLSAEIVVGTTPGGELGGTWPSPTVDTTHSGSSHAGVITAHEALGDPHPAYRLEADNHTHASSGGQAGQVAHSALTGLTSDDHTQYQKESEKGVASGYASLDSGVLVPVAQLGTGTPDGTKFLRDDRTWQTPAGGGGGAPTDATYLVATAHASLSAEVPVGATPGGELGGTWATPTVDTTHAGSAHHTQAHAISGADHTGTLTASQMPAASGCEVSRASQSIGNTATDAISFTDADTTDTDSYHNPASNPTRIVAPFTGRYIVTATVHHESDTNTTGGRRGYIDKNTAGTHALGSLLATSAVAAGTGSGTGGINLVWTGRLIAGDYVEVFYNQSSGTARTVAAKASMEFLGS